MFKRNLYLKEEIINIYEIIPDLFFFFFITNVSFIGLIISDIDDKRNSKIIKVSIYK